MRRGDPEIDVLGNANNLRDFLYVDDLGKVIEEFGILISRRISRYHSKYYEDDEVKFFNNFVICPEQDPNGNELLADLVERKIHFDDCLEIGAEVLFLKNLSLTNHR
jgi:nucleoside-diphosphate-sugar epimerase